MNDNFRFISDEFSHENEKNRCRIDWKHKIASYSACLNSEIKIRYYKFKKTSFERFVNYIQVSDRKNGYKNATIESFSIKFIQHTITYAGLYFWD